jgi:hypothetical protein
MTTFERVGFIDLGGMGRKPCTSEAKVASSAADAGA